MRDLHDLMGDCNVADFEGFSVDLVNPWES